MALCFELIKQIFGLCLMGLGGYILAKSKLVGPRDSRVLSVVSLYLFVPCVMFGCFLVEWTAERISGILLASVGAVLIHMAYLAITGLLMRFTAMMDIDAMSLVFTNAVNIIIPLVLGTLGQQYIFYTSAYVVIQNLLMWTYGVKVLDRKARFQLGRVAKNPVMIAIALGIVSVIFSFRPPAVIETTIRNLASCLGPVAMIQVGVLFAGTDLAEIWRTKGLLRAVILRLMLYPLAALAILAVINRFVHHPESWQILFVVMLAAAAPSSATVVQVAQMYDNEAERAACINVATTCACAVTLPVMTILAQMILR